MNTDILENLLNAFQTGNIFLFNKNLMIINEMEKEDVNNAFKSLKEKNIETCNKVEEMVRELSGLINEDKIELITSHSPSFIKSIKLKW